MSEGTRVEPREVRGLVQVLGAGELAAGEYHCSECGYGVSVQHRLPRCPMCSGLAWEPGRTAGLRLR
jgi:rubrerythrin